MKRSYTLLFVIILVLAIDASAQNITLAGTPQPSTTVTFHLQDPANPNTPYVLALSFGDSPPIVLPDGRSLNLTFDPLLLLSINIPAAIGLSNNIGMLDAQGRSQATFAIPSSQALVGLRLYAAFVTLRNNRIASISPTLPFTIRGQCIYSVRQVNTPTIIEYRFFCTNHHFMTLIDQQGTQNYRPHPGFDPNGWGSSWYMQPFLPGATLRYTRINSIVPHPQGIDVRATGNVSYGSSPFGSWSTQLRFAYNLTEKKIVGEGNYFITLPSNLSYIADLNLYKIASNYLQNVPLVAGSIGDTGDMSRANVRGTTVWTTFTWRPPSIPSHFPADVTPSMLIEVVGDYNQVDTRRMGFNFSIAPAYKPTLTVNITAPAPNTPISFGGFYDTRQNQSFWADNVGITPLILRWVATRTRYDLLVEFSSEAPLGDR